MQQNFVPTLKVPLLAATLSSPAPRASTLPTATAITKMHNVFQMCNVLNAMCSLNAMCFKMCTMHYMQSVQIV